jgi:hypothetical protein
MAKKKTERPRDMANDLISLIRAGTKKWTRTRKAEERNPAARTFRYSRMTRERGVSFKEAAAEIMETAYLKVSDNGKYPANARQIMYAARPHIQEVTGKQLDSNYFTQVLLPDYLQEYDCDDWNVVYDARGHFKEPHDGESFGVGTQEVREYLADLSDPDIVEAELSQAKVETNGPSGNFGALLFIEKEGFDPLLKEAQIAECFDIATMSTKGMSVTAARELADEMCHAYDIPLLTLHDFDKSGFAIAGTLQRDTRRYEFRNDITVIDLGLGLDDVQAMGLAFEHQYHAKGDKAALMANMRENGATDAEIEFMFQDFDRLRSTRRVELNAMTSPQFIRFVERKLRENKIAKIIPDQKLLANAFVAMERGRRLEIEAEKIEKINMKGFKAPGNLKRLVEKEQKKNPSIRWDAAIAAIIRQSTDDE